MRVYWGLGGREAVGFEGLFWGEVGCRVCGSTGGEGDCMV